MLSCDCTALRKNITNRLSFFNVPEKLIMIFLYLKYVQFAVDWYLEYLFVFFLCDKSGRIFDLVKSFAYFLSKMGKEKPGFLTPKAIANRIKSKGLQKLRWYCQMCEKQCRDEVSNRRHYQIL